MLAIRAAVDQATPLSEYTYRWLAFIAALGVILTSAYFLALMRGMLQGGPSAPAGEVRGSVELVADSVPVAEPVVADVRATEWVTWGPLLVLTLLLGVAPGLLLTPVAGSAVRFLGGLG
jgi:NADH-quinone oxidoreductase subunit M